MGGVTPLAICAPGRSGTTFVMELIGSADHVVFERYREYESRYLSYMWRMANLLDPGAQTQWKSADVVKSPFSGPVEPTPYNRDWLEGGQLRDAAFAGLWQALQSRMLAEHGAGREQLVYVEKIPVNVVRDLRSRISLPAIHIIRDPRDVFLSQVAFSEKKSRGLFGMRENESAMEQARRFATGQAERFRQLRELSGEQDFMLVYETLMARPEVVVASLESWLGFALDYGKALGESAGYDGHRTSTENAPRWKSEMNEELVDCFDEILGEHFDELGYPRR